MKLNVFIKPDPEDGGYNVSCPALPGCHSQGETIEEAVTNIQEAIEGCLDVLNNRITSLKPDLQQSIPVFGEQHFGMGFKKLPEHLSVMLGSRLP
jgi:predicted RNase H-like HicB family nuclease